jgi:hypothetical protein
MPKPKYVMSRSDTEMAHVVENAIIIADDGLIEDAALFCKSYDVPFAVAYRIILLPCKRRDYKNFRNNKDGTQR